MEASFTPTSTKTFGKQIRSLCKEAAPCFLRWLLGLFPGVAVQGAKLTGLRAQRPKSLGQLPVSALFQKNCSLCFPCFSLNFFTKHRFVGQVLARPQIY